MPQVVKQTVDDLLMDKISYHEKSNQLRLTRIIRRRRRLRWDPEESSPTIAQQQLAQSGILLMEAVIDPWLCQRITQQIPKLKPVAPTRVIEPTHRQDLLLYPGGYVSEVLRRSWGHIAPVMEPTLGRDPNLVELSAMVSFPGAAPQAPHPDVHNDRGQAPMYSIFIPLTDQTYDMGPLLAWPGTHFGEPPELPMQDVVPMLARAGSMIIMDSRLYHCGGANLSDVPRPVFYFTLRGEGTAPKGSTLSLLPELVGSTLQELCGVHS